MLQIERFALDTVRQLAPVVAVVGSNIQDALGGTERYCDLARQMRRAASSVLLNIAEAQSSFDGNSQ